MPGPLLSAAATVTCAHGGTAAPTRPEARVLLGGAPAVTSAAPYTVSGCPLPVEAGGPCVSAQWLTGAARVQVNGVAVLLTDSRSVCTPPGTSLLVVAAPPRVRGR